jgi:hypothetical protein
VADIKEWWLVLVPCNGDLATLTPYDSFAQLKAALCARESYDVYAYAFWGHNLEFTKRSDSYPFRLLYLPNGLAVPLTKADMAGKFIPDPNQQPPIQDDGYLGDLIDDDEEEDELEEEAPSAPAILLSRGVDPADPDEEEEYEPDAD